MKEKAQISLQKGIYFIERIRFFFQEVIFESKKVTWPERKSVVVFFSVVIFIILLITVFIWGVDFGLLRFIDYLVVRF